MPEVRGVRLGTACRLSDLGELHAREPRKDLPPELLWVVDGAGIGLVPLRQRPLTGRDGGTAPATDLGRLSGVSGDAGIAADVARVRDTSSAVGTSPQRKSGRLSCWGLTQGAPGARTARTQGRSTAATGRLTTHGGHTAGTQDRGAAATWANVGASVPMLRPSLP